ncbi:hypothetical protein HanIR_Chr12g0585431 [Helianthus annuus]|nr:hypothetical protein HanIR_Chr12g0585431 [Helianthus annuus]
MCSFLIWLSSVLILFFVHSLAIATRMHARSIPKNRATLALGKRIRWNHYLFTRFYSNLSSSEYDSSLNNAFGKVRKHFLYKLYFLLIRAYDKDASKFSRRKALTNFEPSSCDGKLSPGTENEGRRQLTFILVILIKAFSRSID